MIHPVVCVPCLSQEHITRQTRESMQALLGLGLTVKVQIATSDIGMARGQILSRELNSGAEGVWWLDGDIVLEDPRAVADAVCAETNVCKIYAAVHTMRSTTVPATSDSIAFGTTKPIRWVGSGCTLVPAAAALKIRQGYQLPELVSPDGVWFPYYWPEIVEAHQLSEAFSLCEKAQACGVEVIADNTHRIGHVSHDLKQIHWSSGEVEDLDS